MLKFMLLFVEARFPGSKPIIEHAMANLDMHEVVAVVLDAIQNHVPNTNGFLEDLRRRFDELPSHATFRAKIATMAADAAEPEPVAEPAAVNAVAEPMQQEIPN